MISLLFLQGLDYVDVDVDAGVLWIAGSPRTNDTSAWERLTVRRNRQLMEVCRVCRIVSQSARSMVRHFT